MASVQAQGTPLPTGSSIVAGSLRESLEERRRRDTPFTLKDAVHAVVPLCLEVAELHARGERLFLHPSSVRLDTGELRVDLERAHQAPTLPRDKSCLAPEERGGEPGAARASVYAVGALLYEMVTAQIVGPGMRRPSELIAGLPPDFEHLLGKALVADAAHRPDDLRALAQAIHHLAPSGTIPPPAADDLDAGLDVDISLSMLPPPPSLGFDVRVVDRSQGPVSDSTSELAALKRRLESDPRPRYVVVKDGMDHGPFTAVELLQQIASGQFLEQDVLKDQFSQDFRAIKDWDEFSPFAEQARLNRDIKAEKVALAATVQEERKSTRSKAVIGVAVVGALLAAVAVVVLTKRGSRSDEIAVQDDKIANVETKGSLNVPSAGAKKPGAGGRGVVGSSGGFPILAGGGSCEAAQAAYVEEMKIGEKGQADLTVGQYASILNKGSYFAHCGVPDDMSINICAAVQNGRAVGVTVSTNPKNPGIQSCIASGVRGLSFPSNPKLDVARTTF